MWSSLSTKFTCVSLGVGMMIWGACAPTMPTRIATSASVSSLPPADMFPGTPPSVVTTPDEPVAMKKSPETVPALDLPLPSLPRTRPPKLPKGPEQAMWKVTQAPDLKDDLDPASLCEALPEHITALRRRIKTTMMIFGERAIPKDAYVDALQTLHTEACKSNATALEIQAVVVKLFDFYEVYGHPKLSPGEVQTTSYFGRPIEGSKERTSEFSHALWARPTDLAVSTITQYRKRKVACAEVKNLPSGSKINQASLCKKKKGTPTLVWAQVPYKISKVGHYTIVKKKRIFSTYYTRYQIQEKRVLLGKTDVLCWVRPLDGYLVEIEGVGLVTLSDGTVLRVRTNGSNGHKFRIFHTKTLQMANHHSAKEATPGWADKARAQLARMLARAVPNQAFFAFNDQGGDTALGVKAVPGRTIATDSSLFPQGALAFLVGKKPVFASPEDEAPSSYEPFSRLVLNQDVGGSIKGPGRVDLYYGEGTEAKRYGSFMNHTGQLFFLVPKEAQKDSSLVANQRVPPSPS